MISEAGLYVLALASRKPEAKAFRRWITHEVIPAIRKDGMYATEALLDDPEHLLRVTERLVEERQARPATEAMVRELAPRAGKGGNRCLHPQLSVGAGRCRRYPPVGETSPAPGRGQRRFPQGRPRGWRCSCRTPP